MSNIIDTPDKIQVNPDDVKQVSSIDELINDPQVAKLAAYFKEQENKPNILTLEEFRRYAPLYSEEVQKEALKVDKAGATNHLIALANEFRQRIDIYSETSIIKSVAEPEEVLRLPAIFTQARSMENSRHTANLSDMLRTHYARGNIGQGNEVEALYWNEFTKANLKDEFVQEIAKKRKRSEEIVESARKVYHGDDVPAEEGGDEMKSSTTSAFDTTEWDDV